MFPNFSTSQLPNFIIIFEKHTNSKNGMNKENYFADDIPTGKLYDTTVIRKLLSYVLRYKASGLLSIFMVLITTVLFLLGPYLLDMQLIMASVRG